MRPGATPSRRVRFRWTSAVALAGSALVSAACTSTPAATTKVDSVLTPSVLPAGAHIVHPTPPPEKAGCGDPTASYRPPAVMPSPGQMPSGSWMAQIQKRGYLRAGVDQNTYLWGYRDPVTGQLEGFDIAMLEQVASAIFGSPGHVHFTVVPNADRVQAVQHNEVDIVAETMTINCAREQSVDFSSVYFEAGEQILVPTNSTITGPDDLGGKKVCAAAGSTSLQNLAALPVTPKVIRWQVPNNADCLVMLEQGQVDAISTDNTILQGLQAQDPNTKIVGPLFSQEPYGMAISKAHPEFTSFVNGVLAEIRANGTWQAIYQRWLGSTGGTVPSPPPATYKATS
jgi:polar amino acid transport system substrate-binding protein